MAEPLKDKKRMMSEDYIKGSYVFESILVTDLKSAVEWYKKYTNNPTKLTNDYPIYIEIMNENLWHSKELRTEYQNWLLDQAFPDITNKN